MAYGFAGHIGFARESAWGSGVAATNFAEAFSEDVSVTIDRFSYKTIIGALAEPDDAIGFNRVSGGIRVPAHPVSIGHFLKAAFGTMSKTTVLSGFLFTNDFFSTAQGQDFSAETPLQPYTFEIFRDVTSAHQYTGMVCDQFSMAFTQGGAVMVDTRWLGRGSAVIAKSTPTFPGSPLKPFTFDTVSLSLGGAANTLIETLTWEVVNNLSGFGSLNLSRDISKVRRTNHQMINIRGSIDFTNVDEYLDFINQTEQRLTISVTKASSFQLVVDIPRMVYTAHPTGIPGRERLTADFTGKGFYHAGSGTAIKVSLTTTGSSYA